MSVNSGKCPDLDAIEKAKNEEIIKTNVEDLNRAVLYLKD